MKATAMCLSAHTEHAAPGGPEHTDAGAEVVLTDPPSTGATSLYNVRTEVQRSHNQQGAQRAFKRELLGTKT